MFEKLKSFIGSVKLVKSTGNTQTVQVALTKDFIIDDVPHIEPYGFTSHPKANAECLVVNTGGNGERPVAVIIGGRAFRLQGLEEGEVALYTDEGDHLIFKRGKIVELQTETLNINAKTVSIDGQTVSISGALNVTGDITGASEVADKTSTLSVIRSTYNAHKHTGNAGYPTSTPDSTMGA